MQREPCGTATSGRWAGGGGSADVRYYLLRRPFVNREGVPIPVRRSYPMSKTAAAIKAPSWVHRRGIVVELRRVEDDRLRAIFWRDSRGVPQRTIYK